MREIKFYNTLTNSVDVFKPIKEGEVSMYVCGPTVYNDPHIGNMRPVVFFDTFRKYLEYIGYSVKYVSNYTDVDDKIINKALAENKTEKEITDFYIAEYRKCLDQLNVAKNFENFWLKKLISTSFANESKSVKVENYQPTLFETQSPKFDKEKTNIKWKIFVLDHDTNQNWKIDVDDLERDYLQWDGDFRSEEVKKLRDEADIIITNPPFSLFREFVAWIMEANKKFLIIWNINCITYKEIFPLIQNNKVWLWNWMWRRISWFIVPKEYELYWSEAKIDAQWNRIVATNSCLWLTNLDHGRRHQPLQLMTMSDNEKFSKHKSIHELWYQKYDNYNAIDIPFTDAIPSDYEWIMWVPITFLDKYNPEQFEIIKFRKGDDEKDLSVNWVCPYFRILIRHKK